MSVRKRREQFERLMLPHLNAAYTLARWLLRGSEEAEDIVQAAYTRAFKYFDQYKEINSKGWLLTIVRNQAYEWLQRNKNSSNLISFDEVVHSQYDENVPAVVGSLSLSPELLAERAIESEALIAAVDRLSIEYREVLLLKEVEGYSYKEIAEIAGIPIGTVMSRLSRARKALLKQVDQQLLRDSAGEL